MTTLEGAEAAPVLASIAEVVASGRLLVPTELTRLVRWVGAEPDRWRAAVRHDPDRRWFGRLHWQPTLDVWLLGWNADQFTTWHDHAGTPGAFCVVEGELVEDFGDLGEPGSWSSRRHRPGDAVGFGGRYLHNLGNLGPAVATSVHAYSPPVERMTFYRLDRAGRLVAVDEVTTDDWSRVPG